MEPASFTVYVIMSLFFGSIFYSSTPEAQARLAAIEARQTSVASTQLPQGLSPSSNLVGTAAFCKLPGLNLPSYPECGASKKDEANRAILIADKR
jgi:hypothetical protein